MKNSHIQSGWKGNLNGVVVATNSTVAVTNVRVELDYETAWALCNVLVDDVLKKSDALEDEQLKKLSNLGLAIGTLIDHDGAKKNTAA